MTRSVKKNRRVLHRQSDLYSLYLWPRVFVTVLNVKKIIKIYRHKPKHNFITESVLFSSSYFQISERFTLLVPMKKSEIYI